MLPVAILMIEHRLIERMIKVMNCEIDHISASSNPDMVLVDSLVDFIRTYADRTHHGKEEEILFKAMAQKKLPDRYQHTMDELVMEHVFARNETQKLAEAKTRCMKGDKGALSEMARTMRILADFYPKHIIKEDKDFFIPVMDHFRPPEREKMLQDFHDFDHRMIHEKYDKLTRKFELEKKLPGANSSSAWLQQI